MVQRNWKQLKAKWVKGGCPPLAQFFRAEGIPRNTGYKAARSQGWTQLGQEVDTETNALLVQKSALQNAGFRDRLTIIGRALQEEALLQLKITPENAMEALRLAARLEEIGTYGPAGLRGEGTPLVAQTNTVVYQQVLQIVQTTGSKQRRLLAQALKRLKPPGAARSKG